ncbi:MAG TPA: D-alanyl-D-alanine carboxypeptidase family protein [Candidatus Nanoarchaeia archaeon]|nr:D-alanyl-D-alanine carboxypeptidase family protein [Candidatus Nanoarchaeia archaeon]
MKTPNKKSQEGGPNWLVISFIIIAVAVFIYIFFFSQTIGKEKTTIVSEICKVDYLADHAVKNLDCPCEGLECKTKSEIDECNKQMADWCREQEAKKKIQKSGSSSSGGSAVTYEPETKSETAKTAAQTPYCTGNLVDPPFTKGCAPGETCKVRERIIPFLKKAYDLAKNEGRELQLLSGYRIESEQSSIWEKSRDSAKVCSPDNTGSFAQCPHVSGCAVDVGFVFNKNNLYEGYSENLLEMRDSNERNLLKKIMLEAGFKNYCPESWHFEYGTTGYAKAGSSDCYTQYWQ